MKTMHERLSGKLALITHTSGGQGRAAAKPFTAAESNDECKNIGESEPDVNNHQIVVTSK